MVDIRTGLHDEVDKLIHAGIQALEMNAPTDAHRMFEEAYKNNPRDMRACSYYGYTLALVEDKVHKGLELCVQACRSDAIVDAMVFHNLAMIYVKLGKKREAVGAFKRGLSIDRSNKKIYEAWKSTLGVRRKPVIPFLSRDNFLNKLLGKWTHKN